MFFYILLAMKNAVPSLKRTATRHIEKSQFYHYKMERKKCPLILVYMKNIHFNEGRFPKYLQVAKVILIHKTIANLMIINQFLVYRHKISLWKSSC